MSVTVSTFQNFVGGKWVDAAEGGTAEIVNPSTGETISEVPNGTQADVDRAVEAAKTALPEWLETTPGERAEMMLEARGRARRQHGGAGSARVPERRQAAARGAGRDARFLGQHPLLRRRGAHARRSRSGRVHARVHVDDPPRAGRDRRPDLPVELPADDGRLEDRAGAGRGQRGRAQAVRADAHDDAADGAARGGDLPRRGPERDHRRRRAGRRGHRAPSRRAHGLAHRRRGHGQGGRARRGGQPQARPPRARRQGARDRLRRRGSRSPSPRGSRSPATGTPARTAPPPRA